MGLIRQPQAVTHLTGDEATLGEIELLLIVLQRTSHLSRPDALKLQLEYLRENIITSLPVPYPASATSRYSKSYQGHTTGTLNRSRSVKDASVQNTRETAGIAPGCKKGLSVKDHCQTL